MLGVHLQWVMRRCRVGYEQVERLAGIVFEPWVGAGHAEDAGVPGVGDLFGAADSLQER